jgi:phage repressor protein C with HTH and peptisase S24 domain
MQYPFDSFNAYMQRDCIEPCRQNAPMTNKRRIRDWYSEVLRETGWSAAQWARLASTSPTNITRLQKDPDAAAPRTETLQKLFRVLPQPLRNKAPNFLFGDIEPVTGVADSPTPYVAETEVASAIVALLGQDGKPAAQIKAPPSLIDIKGAYALYAGDGSMEPRYFEGDLVYVNPVQPPRLNDFVVVRFASGGLRIRRLIGRTEEKVTLESYNPAGSEEVARGQILDLHRILNSDELWR